MSRRDFPSLSPDFDVAADGAADWTSSSFLSRPLVDSAENWDLAAAARLAFLRFSMLMSFCFMTVFGVLALARGRSYDELNAGGSRDDSLH